MAYVLKYKPNGQYLNIGGFLSTEPFNLGINPRIYKTIDDAKKDIDFGLDMEIERFKRFLYSGKQALKTTAKPTWYDVRHTKKLTKRQAEKLEWYERALDNNDKLEDFINKFRKSDVIIEEWKE